MMTAAFSSKEFYRSATKDIFDGRDTEAARELIEKLRSELRSGDDFKTVRKKLIASGAPDIWAGRAVNEAANLNFRDILSAAAADLAQGKSDTPSLAVAIRFAQQKLAEDPRRGTLAARLAASGYPEALASWVAESQPVAREQKISAWVSVVLGLAFAAFGFWVMLGPSEGDSSYQSKALLPVILGLAAVGRGIAGLLRR